MIEILAKAPLGDLQGKIPVGHRDHPNVDMLEPIAAQWLDLAFLQHPQQLRLQLQRQLAHLVQHQGAAVGHLEVPAMVAGCPGERPAPMAEQGALDQRGRQRGAVHHHQGPIGTSRAVMEGMGDALLADAGLAQHQHAHVGGGDQFHRGHQLAHGATAPAGQPTRQLAVVIALQGELQAGAVQTPGQPQAGAQQLGRRQQALVIQLGQRPRGQGVQGDHADQLIAVAQRHPQAIMDRAKTVIQQSVVGIRKGRVRGKAADPRRLGDGGEARMLAQGEGPAGHALGQADGGHRPETGALRHQQRAGIRRGGGHQ